MPYNKRVQTNNASTSELNGTTGIQLKNYMKASSSSSVDAELLPFEDAELLPLDDAELLPFEDAILLPLDDVELLPFDDAEPGSGGMKISSSSSLSSVHKNGWFSAVLLKVSLFGSTTFFHLASIKK